MGGERGAHFFEYSGELLNNIFALIFTLIRYQSVQEDIKTALFGSDQEVLKILKSLKLE